MEGYRFSRCLCLGVLCCILAACGASAYPSASPLPPLPVPTTVVPTPPSTSTPSRSHTPILSPSPTRTPVPTATPTPIPADGSGYVPDLFAGCWQFETEEVQFELQLEQRGADLKGTFLLIKLCVVDDVVSACRIREGTIAGTVAAGEIDVSVDIPEYQDQGTARLTVADDWGSLLWQELDYPEAGLADFGVHYLPPTFTLVPCDV